MIYNRLGDSGLFVSRLGLGTWVTITAETDHDHAYSLMKLAYEAGVNFFDNAEIYESGAAETVMGVCVNRGIKEGVWKRSDLVLTTKLFFGASRTALLNNAGLSRKHIVEGMQASLERMQLDYVDVVYCHRPDSWTPIEETVRAMNFLIEQGKAFYWGTSEWSSTELMEAMMVADRLNLIRPITEQSEYNILARHRVEVEHVPIYERFGMGNTIWSPLAGGVLTGKYKDGIPEGSRLSLPKYQFLKERMLGKDNEHVETANKLAEVAKRLGISITQMCLAWTLKNPHLSVVLLGASSIAQLKENLSCLEALPKLTDEVMREIDEVAGNKPEISAIHQQIASVRMRHTK